MVEAGSAVDAGGGGRGEGKIESFPGKFEPSQGVAIAGQIVAAIDGRLFKLASAEESWFGFGETGGGDAGEAESAPGGRVVGRLFDGADEVGFGLGEGGMVRQEEEKEKRPDHGSPFYSLFA